MQGQSDGELERSSSVRAERPSGRAPAEREAEPVIVPIAAGRQQNFRQGKDWQPEHATASRSAGDVPFGAIRSINRRPIGRRS